MDSTVIKLKSSRRDQQHATRNIFLCLQLTSLLLGATVSHCTISELKVGVLTLRNLGLEILSQHSENGWSADGIL